MVAVHRLGSRLPGRLGDVVLRPGDTLLLEAAPGFARRHRQSRSFYLVSEVAGAAAPRHERAWVSVGILAGLVVVMSCSDLPVKIYWLNTRNGTSASVSVKSVDRSSILIRRVAIPAIRIRSTANPIYSGMRKRSGARVKPSSPDFAALTAGAAAASYGA